MTTLPLPVKLPLWELCYLDITRAELRGVLGEPHFVDRTELSPDGIEDGWGFTLPSGQRVLVTFQVPIRRAYFSADPPQLNPVLAAFHIASDDLRLGRYPQPIALK